MNGSGLSNPGIQQYQAPIQDEEEDTIWGASFLTIVILLFVLGFLSILGYLLVDQYVSVFSTTTMWDGNMAGAANSFLFAQRAFDYFIVLVMVGALVALGTTSYRISTAPVFFFITLIMGGFLCFVSYVCSYAFQEYAKQSVFSTIIVYFPRTVMICTNLHWVALAALIVGSITLYAKRPTGSGFVE